MATFEITTPDGKKYKVQGETREGALRALQTHLGQGYGEVPAREEISRTGGITGAATQGFMFGGGDEYLAGLSAVLGLQPDGAGGADWFQYEKPMKERYGVALDAIRSEMGQFAEDNPKTSAAAQIGGGIGGAVVAGSQLPIKAAATGWGRLWQTIGGGAVGGAVEGFNQGEGSFGRRAKRAAIGGTVGAVFAPLVGIPLSKLGNWASKKGGSALRKVFANRQTYDHRTGQLTARGVQRLRDLGFEPNDLSKEMQQAFGESAEQAARAGVDDAGTVGRMATARRFDVPLTAGQASGDVIQSAKEQGYRAGVRGRGASQAMEAFDATQQEAVESARGRMGTAIGAETADRVDAADAVISGVRREAEAARQAGKAAYQALEDSGTSISGGAVENLGDVIERRVSMSGFRVGGDTPNAKSAIAFLSNRLGRAKGSVPFDEIERTRQGILRLQRAAQAGSNGADQEAMRDVVGAFDDWLDDTMTLALTQGDGAALAQAKDARGLWQKYKSTYMSKDGADRFIRKIVEDDISPDQVASWLYGGATTPGGGQTSLVAKRIKDILGENSPEWGAVKRAAWDHITKAPEGKDFGPQRVASNLSEFINGKGKALSRELFSPREIKQISEFRDMMKTLVPPPRSTNPSGSGYEVQRGMIELLGTISGGSSGGPLGAVAGREAITAGADFSGAMRARAAARGIVDAPASVSGAIGAGVGAGSVAQERTAR